MRYPHWRNVPRELWRWPNFSPEEIACRGTGKILINELALDRLQHLRSIIGKPMIVTSAYRSPEHNRTLKGAAANSRHMIGDAFDVSMANQDPHDFEAAARACGFTAFGYYPSSNFMHIDCGPSRTWGTPFPIRKTRFSTERAPVENLGGSRTVVGASSAGAGGVALVADGVAQLTQAEGHFNAGTLFGLVIGSLVLVGAALALYARWDDAGRPLPWRS
jgi:zinc D-Ala-D-Ala carboxypeptidase